MNRNQCAEEDVDGVACDSLSVSAMAKALSKKVMWMMVCHINTFSS
jgi:hypothetical protein